MKLYEITIKPAASFGTPLKGDTLFGHFCWQVAYEPEILRGGLDRWLELYDEKPFIIFSSAFPKIVESNRAWYAMKRPDLPLSVIFPGMDEDRCAVIKRIKGKKRLKWMRVDSDLSIDLGRAEFYNDTDLWGRVLQQAGDGDLAAIGTSSMKTLCINFDKHQNTINRSTMTTGEGMFSPYTVSAFSYYPETRLSVFCLLDEEATDIDRVFVALERIGRFGFGRDASSGLGKFRMEQWKEVGIPSTEGVNACYALSPVVPEQDAFVESYFTPFVRFGKHGDSLARSGNPYKNPVIMADEGAVLVPGDKEAVFARPYIGRALRGLSKADPRTVHQGYAIYLPLKMGGRT